MTAHEQHRFVLYLTGKTNEPGYDPADDGPEVEIIRNVQKVEEQPKDAIPAYNR